MWNSLILERITESFCTSNREKNQPAIRIVTATLTFYYNNVKTPENVRERVQFFPLTRQKLNTMHRQYRVFAVDGFCLEFKITSVIIRKLTFRKLTKN